VLNLGVTAALKDIYKPNQVAVNIGMGICERVSNARLRGKVYYALRTLLIEKLSHFNPIRNIDSGKTKPRMIPELSQPSFLQRHIVVVVQVVNANNIFTASKQTLTYVHADKTCCAGHQNFH